MALFKTTDEQQQWVPIIADRLAEVDENLANRWETSATEDRGLFELGELWMHEKDLAEKESLFLAIEDVLREIKWLEAPLSEEEQKASEFARREEVDNPTQRHARILEAGKAAGGGPHPERILRALGAALDQNQTSAKEKADVERWFLGVLRRAELSDTWQCHECGMEHHSAYQFCPLLGIIRRKAERPARAKETASHGEGLVPTKEQLRAAADDLWASNDAGECPNNEVVADWLWKLAKETVGDAR